MVIYYSQHGRTDVQACGSVGIGRRARLRILWQQCRVGSSPIFRIRLSGLRTWWILSFQSFSLLETERSSSPSKSLFHYCDKSFTIKFLPKSGKERKQLRDFRKALSPELFSFFFYFLLFSGNPDGFNLKRMEGKSKCSIRYRKLFRNIFQHIAGIHMAV